ncbi:MAG: YciI family protein [Nocardioides sp.]
MTSYVVLLPGDESAWDATPEPQKQEMYQLHAEFAKQLAERGHKVTGGAELAPSREARVLRTSASGEQTVTQGPYAETAEQLTGFYVVDTTDLDDLIEVCQVLGRGETAIEIRECRGGGM